jgi:hypothetical protein
LVSDSFTQLEYFSQRTLSTPQYAAIPAVDAEIAIGPPNGAGIVEANIGGIEAKRTREKQAVHLGSLDSLLNIENAKKIENKISESIIGITSASEASYITAIAVELSRIDVSIIRPAPASSAYDP